MNQKYIFIDIDGTLFDHSTESIPESALIALNKAHKKGHKIYLSTGRANTEIDYEYSALPISGMILSCGAQVIVDNKIIYLANYPRNELTQLMEYMLKNNIGFALDGYKKSYFSDEAFHIFSSLILQNENQNSEERAVAPNQVRRPGDSARAAPRREKRADEDDRRKAAVRDGEVVGILDLLLSQVEADAEDAYEVKDHTADDERACVHKNSSL